MGCKVDRYTFCERERVDMENGKTRRKRMDIRGQILGMDIGRMEQQPQ